MRTFLSTFIAIAKKTIEKSMQSPEIEAGSNENLFLFYHPYTYTF